MACPFYYRSRKALSGRFCFLITNTSAIEASTDLHTSGSLAYQRLYMTSFAQCVYLVYSIWFICELLKCFTYGHASYRIASSTAADILHRSAAFSIFLHKWPLDSQRWLTCSLRTNSTSILDSTQNTSRVHLELIHGASGLMHCIILVSCERTSYASVVFRTIYTDSLPFTMYGLNSIARWTYWYQTARYHCRKAATATVQAIVVTYRLLGPLADDADIYCNYWPLWWAQLDKVLWENVWRKSRAMAYMYQFMSTWTRKVPKSVPLPQW